MLNLVAKAAAAFDKVRPKLMPSGVRLELLKASETANVYEELWQLDSSWFFDTDRGEIYIAEGELNLSDPMAAATHARVTDGVNSQVYVISADDTLAPDVFGATRAFWTLKVSKSFQRSQTRPLY